MTDLVDEPFAYDTWETDESHNLNCWGSDRYWTTDASDPPTGVTIESERRRTRITVTLASGAVHTFICERESSAEQGCWHFLTGAAVPHRRALEPRPEEEPDD